MTRKTALASVAATLTALALIVGGCGSSDVVVRECGEYYKNEYGDRVGCKAWKDTAFKNPPQGILNLPSCADGVRKPCRMS